MFSTSAETKEFIGTMVRGIYDLQKLRIQFGNRMVGNFKNKFKESIEEKNDKDYSEEELEFMTANMTAMIRKDYKRIADAVADGNSEKIISLKKFKPQGLITDYNEYILVRQYIRLLDSEEEAFKQLGRVLENVPIYSEFLKTVGGVGPAVAGVIISEIDIHKAQTSSALWRYAGLDTVLVGEYYDDKNERHIIPHIDFIEKYGTIDDGESIYFNGHLVNRIFMGRTLRKETMTLTTYIDKEGKEQIRKTIGHNPFLKSKLMGVLATSFLRSGIAIVDGKQAGALKRLEMATEEGFDVTQFETSEIKTEVIKFLSDKGHDILVEPSKYGKIYYNYRERLNHMREHDSKSSKYKHNMALRYCVKRFLVDLYTKWRTIEGLEVTEEYAVRKLGLVHHDSDYSNVA